MSAWVERAWIGYGARVNASHLLLTGLLVVECMVLYLGQRRLFFRVERATGSRLLSLVVAAPGVILHEFSHLVMCWLLRVPAGSQLRRPDGTRAQVEFFRPREERDGITLGRVPHAGTDPLRSSLIAVAPVLFVPLLLFVLSTVLLRVSSVVAMPHALEHTAWWRVAIWAYVALSCGEAAFPSVGDHIGSLGAGCLFWVALIFGLILIHTEGLGGLVHDLADVSLLLLVPATAAGGCLVLCEVVVFVRGRARRLVDKPAAESLGR